MDIYQLDPVLLDFSDYRRAQKQKYFGEMFLASMKEISGTTFLEFFQIEKRTGAAKGIIRIQPPFHKAPQ